MGAISPESARLEPFIYPLIEKVVRLPGYSDHWVEHVPRYTFVVAFTRPPSLAEIQRLAPPEIRDRIAVRTAKRSQEEIGRARDLITERLRAARIGSWSSGYNPVSQCFEIGVESAARIEQVRALLPADVLVDADFRVQGPLRTF
ncbi:hypothetical protein GCM10007925_09540 [Sphingomonas astaxanthinifaciens DSM 22298]|uniref:Uncharacterized protein n=1 Tax=Sphingomonas astaxanthinifaciens DSM 22298 TaxID=1123267 RepID=A0ABQ5Z3D2_9SPHN|nr:hypothetical protein GCM10007925_09540 [Sphingomonas astaxanthinifaciens DSM 22298]